MRQPHQILAFPFIKENDKYLFGIFCRNGSKEVWQGIAGGVEENETYIEACQREAFEEAGITDFSNVIELESMCTIPVPNVTKKFLYGPSFWNATVPPFYKTLSCLPYHARHAL